MKKQILLVLTATWLLTGGCSFILGEDTAPPQGFTLQFVENLRNEASLRGEGLKETALNTDQNNTLQRPNNVYADAFRVYVTDENPPRVFVFDRGTRRATILDGTQPPTEDELKLVAPSGIAVDSAGVIYTSDSQQGRVFGSTGNGKVLWVLGGTIGAFSIKPSDLTAPGGIVADHRRNRLYVADTQAHKVKVFSLSGDQLFDIGASGKKEEAFKFPGALALDKDQNLYILDTLSRRVHIYGPDDKFVKSVNLKATATSEVMKPRGIAVASDGHLFVSDSLSNNILIYDREGAFVVSWGRTGGLIGEFRTPAGIFIDEKDMVYVADRMNGRVQVFQYVRSALGSVAQPALP
jgi:DNA-binding beta-propeller fold protein YncE